MQLRHGLLHDHGGILVPIVVVVNCEGSLASKKVEEAAADPRLEQQEARCCFGSSLSVSQITTQLKIM